MVENPIDLLVKSQQDCPHHAAEDGLGLGGSAGLAHLCLSVFTRNADGVHSAGATYQL